MPKPFKFHQCYLNLYVGEQTRYEVRNDGILIGYASSEYAGNGKTRWFAWNDDGLRAEVKSRFAAADALYEVRMRKLYPEGRA